MSTLITAHLKPAPRKLGFGILPGMTGLVVVGWLGWVHLKTPERFLLRICLLCVMFSRVFCVLHLLAFGQDAQLSMAAVRPLDLLARSPIGRASS